MARRFGRRRPRGVWLPNVGQPDWSPGNPVGIQPSYIDANFTITLGGERTPTAEFPLFEDGNSQQLLGLASVQDQTTKGLNDLIEWGYRLRRIVGQISVTCGTTVQDQTNVTRDLAGLICTAAIIVRKQEALGVGGSLASLAGDINTQDYENVRDPWIWRRSWPLLNSQVGLVAGSDPTGASPEADAILSESIYSPYEAGDMRSGPHVDAKTARIIGAEERCYLDVSWRNRHNDQAQVTDWDVSVFFDYRGFATLRSNQGNRRNTSR